MTPHPILFSGVAIFSLIRIGFCIYILVRGWKEIREGGGRE